MKKFLRVLIALIIVTATAGAIVLAAVVKLNEAPAGMPEETVFRVQKGEYAATIGKRLEEEGLIKSSSFFISLVKIRNSGGLMKSGLYRINGGSSCTEIHDVLLRGSEELFQVSIPPGLSSAEIAEILQDAGIVSGVDFSKAVKDAGAEGMLFPDTYKFPKDYPANMVVEYMIENFNAVMQEVYPEHRNMEEQEVNQKIVMASIIEREYRVKDEAPLIASVFYNRIESNMYLGSCATVVYVITEEQGKPHPEKLLFRDLEIESSFNTYINKGLPPGPICNPGRTALDAAFNPADTDFLYFLLEDPEKGTHFFSKTLAEHNKSYELYIKGK